MRLAVYILCGLYALLWGFAVWDTASHAHPTDPAGTGIEWGYIQIGVTITLIFAVPAFFLALFGVGKALRVALILALFPGVALLAFLGIALGGI